MKLNKLALEDRSFLIQFDEIFKEFWGHIPWLDKIKDVKYLTDTDVFSSQLLENLWLNPDVEINPYILTNDVKWKEYIWSILNFSTSPEHFVDPNNEVIRQQLEHEKYAYITCLQIRDVFRNERYWTEIISKSVEQMLKQFHKFRWVVSDPKLLPYYGRFGFEVVNDMPNKDWLYIITSDEKLFIKRH
jgi:hypothetical protein